MELVDEHMQLDFGGAPQNYWGLPRHPPPGAEGEDTDAVDDDEDDVDEDDMSPAEVRASSVRCLQHGCCGRACALGAWQDWRPRKQPGWGEDFAAGSG